MSNLKISIQNINKAIKKTVLNVNSGGCAHFAYYLSKKLSQLNTEHTVVLLNNRYESPIEDFSETVAHVMIHVKELGYIDGEGIYSKLPVRYTFVKHFNAILGELDYYRNKDGWNWLYSIEQNLSIEKIISDYLSNGPT